MRLVLVLTLIWVGILEIPLSDNLETKLIAKGEVRGKETESLKLFKPAAENPSLSSPSPSLLSSPILSPIPPPSLTPVAKATKEIILLSKEKQLRDQKLELFFPQLNQHQSWRLELELELFSEEDVLGFDSPGLTIHLDDDLVYQQSGLEPGFKKISFNPQVFSNNPQTLTIWSGNGGDKLKDTHTTIKKVKLIVEENHSFIETESIDDLAVTVDNQDFLTLEWSSPKTDDYSLSRALAYQVRSSTKPITLENWSQAQVVKIFLPENFSPQPPTTKELALIKAPPINSGYLVIRSLDSSGLFSPLGESVPFLLK